MDIQERVKEANKKLKSLTEKQKGFYGEIDKTTHQKEQIILQAIMDGAGNDKIKKVKDLSERLRVVKKDFDNYDSLEKRLMNIYQKSFKYMVNKRLITPLIYKEHKRNGWNYVHGNLVVLNTKGLAHITQNYDKYDWAYHLTNMTDIVHAINDFPEIAKYIKKDNMKEVFKIFRRNLKKWVIYKFPDFYNQTQNKPYSLIDVKRKEQFGKVCEIETYTRQGIRIKKDYQGFYVSVTDNIQSGYSWGGTRILIGEENGLSEEQLHLIAQFPDEIVNGIEDYVKTLEKTKGNNEKVLEDIKEEVKPYLMASIL